MLELALHVSIKEIFEARSIGAFVGIVCERVIARKGDGGNGEVTRDE